MPRVCAARRSRSTLGTEGGVGAGEGPRLSRGAWPVSPQTSRPIPCAPPAAPARQRPLPTPVPRCGPLRASLALTPEPWGCVRDRSSTSSASCRAFVLWPWVSSVSLEVRNIQKEDNRLDAKALCTVLYNFFTVFSTVFYSFLQFFTVFDSF